MGSPTWSFHMKKIITLFAILGISLATIVPANAWYRRPYYGGYYGYGGWGPGTTIVTGKRVMLQSHQVSHS